MKCFYTIVSIILISVSTLFGQDTLTYGQVYDYEVGDVFHWYSQFESTSSGGYEYENIEILDKYYSSESDTVFYIAQVISDYLCSPNLESVITTSIDTIFYSNLNGFVKNGNIDDSYSDPTLYNGRLINTYGYHNYPDPSTRDYEFIRGIGCNHKRTEGGFVSSHFSKDILYYKKGEEIWGSPHFVSVENNPIDKLNIYPNPANSVITIEGFDSKSELHIYNLTGQLVKTAMIIPGEKSSIDVSFLKKGTYLLCSNINGKVHTNKLIILK